jgi:xanthine/uracil permease
VTEYNRRATDNVPAATGAVTIYAKLAVFLVAFTIVAIISARMLIPDDTGLVVSIIGVGILTIQGLNSMMHKNQATASDGRFEQLLVSRTNEARYEGLVEGLKENPDVNIGQRENQQNGNSK